MAAYKLTNNLVPAGFRSSNGTKGEEAVVTSLLAVFPMRTSELGFGPIVNGSLRYWRNSTYEDTIRPSIDDKGPQSRILWLDIFSSRSRDPSEFLLVGLHRGTKTSATMSFARGCERSRRSRVPSSSDIIVGVVSHGVANTATVLVLHFVPNEAEGIRKQLVCSTTVEIVSATIRLTKLEIAPHRS